MRKLTTILAAAAAPAALAAVLLGTAGQASAATTAAAPAAVTVAAVTPAHARVVIAHTYRAGVPDTTSVAGPGTVASPNGPQWAADDLEATFTATPVAGQAGVWDVKVYSAGVYHAFANPRTGAAWKATGPMGGWIDYQVTSQNIPNARNLPATSPGTVTTSSLIGELFGGQARWAGADHRRRPLLVRLRPARRPALPPAGLTRPTSVTVRHPAPAHGERVRAGSGGGRESNPPAPQRSAHRF